MIETYLYFSEPVDIHMIRSVLGSKLPESPRDFLVYVGDDLRVEIEYSPSGLPLVDSDVYASDGPYLEQVACWGRLSITAWESHALSEAANALLPIMWLADTLQHFDYPFRWFDPYSQEVNTGFDLYDVVRYYEAANLLAPRV
jgi:hypothetical protein